MKGFDLLLYWVGFAFIASLIWQIVFDKTPIDMLKQAVLILMYAVIWEFIIGYYFRNKEKA